MMEYPTLYKKERSTLEFIKDYMSKHRTAPSLEEIRKHFGKKSLATVHKSLGQLETKGYIERNKHHGRSITLTELALEYFDMKPENSLALLGTVKAGPNGIHNYSEVEEYIEVPASIKKENRYVMKVEGDSMIDAFINEGDYVIVEKAFDLPVNQVVIASLDEYAYIKRLIKRSNGQIILRSENPDYDDIYVKNPEQLRIEGKIVQVIRNYG